MNTRPLLVIAALVPLAGCASLGRAIHRHPIIAGAVASVVIAGAVYAAEGPRAASRAPRFVEHIPLPPIHH